MALAPGIRLGAYEIAARIGVGGMGEVYQATDTNLKRTLAIKVLPEGLTLDPDRLARFRREAQVLAALNHPNICTIYDIHESDGRPFLAMEFLEGQTLKHRIGGKPFPVDSLLDAGGANCRRARRRAREGHRASGHQTGEYFRDRSWARQASGLRAGQSRPASEDSRHGRFRDYRRRRTHRRSI